MVEYNWLIFFVIYSRIMDFVEKINGTYSIFRGCLMVVIVNPTIGAYHH